MKFPKPKTFKPSIKNLSLRQSKFSKLQVIAFIAVFAIIGGVILLSSKAAGPAVWVSTTGNDSTCVRNDSTKPCATFQKAYNIALCGDTIGINPGTYNDVEVDANGSNCSVNTTFAPVSGVVTIASNDGKTALSLGGNCKCSSNPPPNHVTFDGGTSKNFHFGVPGVMGSGGQFGQINLYPDYDTGTYPSNITLTNLVVENKTPDPGGGAIELSSPQNVTISNSTIGPICCGVPWGGNGSTGDSPTEIVVGSRDQFDPSCPSGGCLPPNNVKIQNNQLLGETYVASEWPTTALGPAPQPTCTDTNACHADAIHVVSGSNFTITGNQIYHSHAQTIFMEPIHAPLGGTNLIANNFLDTSNKGACGFCVNGQGAGVGGSWTVAFNTGGPDDGIGFSTSNPADYQPGISATFVGNYGTHGSSGCVPWGTYKSNMWADGQCSATDFQGNASYVVAHVGDWGDGSTTPDNNTDYSLLSSSPAKDFVPSSTCTTYVTNDIFGNARPSGTACDAGAHEYTSAASSANIWISTSGNDSTCMRGDQTKPCATFQKACMIAVGGDIVEIANGTYAPQLISSCSPTSTVTFQPATGATVNLNRGLNITGCSYDPLDNRTANAGYGDSCGLRVSASSNLTFKDLKLLDQWNVDNGASNISMVNIKAQRMKGGCLTNLSVTGGDYGPYDEGVSGHDSGGSHFIPEVGGCGANGITINGANFHDYSCDSSCLSSGAHSPDCVTFYGNGNGTLSGSVLVQHSKFVHCGGFDAWAKNTYNGSVWFSSITFRNNFFGKNNGGDPFEVEFASDNTSTVISNVHLEYNSFDSDDTGTPIAFCSSGCSFSNNTVTGNVLSGLFGPPCGTPGITASYNVGLFFNSSCGPTNFVSTGALSEYTNRTNVDFHLALSTSPAVDRGGTACVGMTDIDGNARPQGTACDAGAHEYTTGGTTSIPGDLNNDGHVTVIDLSILLSHYGTSGTASQGDCNNDGLVNILDLSILLSHYGT